MAKLRKSKRSGGSEVEKLPEPTRSMGQEVRKDVAHSENTGESRDSADTQAAEQMEEWVASRAPAHHPDRSK